MEKAVFEARERPISDMAGLRTASYPL